MASKGKKYSDMAKLIDKNASYPIQEAMELVCKTSPVKFDATVEIAFRLGVDPRQADQQIRGAVGLPNGTGKNPVVIVFAKGDKAKEAEAAGADFVGDSDLVNKIQQGWLEFDVAVATPDMMPEVGRLGKILGPRSLMPTPKVGTVTADVTKAITEIKAGKVEYRVDKAGNVHMLLGKVSFGPEKLMANFNTVYETILRAKPSTSKGIYIKNVALASTMGPGVRVATDSVTIKL